MNITLKINSANGTIETVKINTVGTDAVRVQAHSNVNYELINDLTQVAPENIMVARSGNDLHIAFEGSEISQPDLIIEDYYNEAGDNLLIGLHENGNYYAYVPESGQQLDAVVKLADQVSAGQVLGTQEFITSPVWAFNPGWLIGLLAVAGIAAAAGGSGGGDDNKPASPPPPPADNSVDKPNVTTNADNNVNVEPNGDATKVTSKYIDGNGNEQRIIAVKDPQSGNWTATDTNGNPISNTASDTAPSIDSNTGTVTIPGTIVKDGSDVTAVSQDDAGNTSSNDLSFSAPKLPVELNMQAGEYNPSAKTYDAKISVALKKGADKVVFSMPGGGAFTLTEEDLARLDEDGNAINGYSFDLHKLAIDTRLTNFDNVLYGQVLAQIKQGQKLSVLASKTGYNDGTDDSNLSASPTVTSTPTGGATVKIADDAGETIITYKDSTTGDDRTITVSNGVATLDDGTILPAESPKGAEPSFDPNTGTVRIPASQVQDHTDVKAETTKDSGGNSAPSLPEQGTVLGENNKPKVVAEDDGSATITPTASATEVITDYTDEKGDGHIITTTKQPDGTWMATDKATGNPIATASNGDKPWIDPNTGTVTLPPAAVKDGSTVIAEQTGPDGTGSDSSSTIEDNTPKPEVSAEKNGDVIIRPNDKAIFSTTTYTDDEGNTHQIEAKKDPSNNTWAATDKTMGNNPIATAPNGDKPWIDPNTGVISIPDKAVKDGTDVGASQVIDDNGNRKSSGEATATAKTPPAINTADVDADDKGNVTISPSGDATGTNTSYVGEDDKPKTIVATKDPNTGKWTGTDQDGNPISDTPSKDKPSIDPNTGVISIPDSAVKDNSTVETTQETPAGTSRPSTAITNGDIPPADIDAKEDGSVKVKPTEDATGVDVSYEGEDGKPQTITTTKQPDGTWKGKDQVGNPISDMPSKDKPSIDPNTGTVTLPPTAVKDGSKVTATQDTPAGTSKDSSATAKDNIPEPEVKAHEDASVTIKPSEDASSTTTNYVDDKDLPNTITATKDPNTGKWTAKNQDDKALDTTPNEQYPWIDPNTGIISIPDKAVKDGSIVSAQQETPAGTSGKDTAVASTAPDTTPPKITDAQVSSDGKSIVLSYDENLGGTKASTDMFTVTLGSGKTVTVTDVSIKDKEVTLKLNTPIYQGDNVSIDYSSGDKKHQDPSNPATQDKAGNDADDLSGYTVSNGSSVTEPSLNITHAIDNVDPQTGNVMHDGHSNDKTPTLVITLDRDLEEGEVVTVYDKAGTKLGEATAKPNAAGGTEYHFTTDELPEDTAEFTAKVHKGKDLVTSSNNFSLNIDLTAPDYKATVEIQDGGDGIINAAEKEADVKVNITAPAEAKEGDVIEVKVGNDVIATYTVGKDIKAGKSKEADIPTGKIPADGKDALKVTATITDKAGNTGEASEATATVDTTPPIIDGTPTIDKTGKELKIPFNEELKGDVANEPKLDDFTVTVNGTDFKPSGVSIKDKEVTLSFNTPIPKGAEVTLAYKDSTPNDAAGIVDKAGNSNTGIQDTKVSNGSAVTTGIGIEKAFGNQNQGELGDGDHTDAKKPKLAISATRSLKTGEKIEVYDVNGNKVDGELEGSGTDYLFTPETELGEGEATFTAKIVDANGKVVASSGEFSLNIDYTAPILEGMQVKILDDGDGFSGSINAAEKKAGVKVRVTASPKAVEGDIIKLKIGDKTEEITIGTGEGKVAPGEFIDIPVDDDKINDGKTLNVKVVEVKDKAGNTASNDTLKDSSEVDLTAPTRTANEPSIDASGTKITIPYDENLATGDKAPDLAAFTVTKNGSTVTPNSVTVNGNNIELNFTIPFVSTDNVKVAYTDPSAGDDTKAIQDAAGNDAATFAAKEVKNNSTKEAPAINIHTIAGQSEAQDKGSSKHIDSDGYARLTDKLIKSGFEIAGTAENIANGTDVKVQILDEKGAAIWTETVKVADEKWNATVVPKAINDFDSTKVYKVKAEATVNGESKIDEDLLKSPIKIENLQAEDDVAANTSPTPASYSGGYQGKINSKNSTSYTDLKTGLTNDKAPKISFEIDRELAEGESVVLVRQAVSRDSKGNIIGKSAEQTVYKSSASGTKTFSFEDNLEDSYGTEYIYTAKVIDKTGVLAKQDFSIKLDTMIEAFDTETVVQSDRNGTTITGTAEKGAKITLTYRNTDGNQDSQTVNADASGKFNLTLPSTWDRKSKNAQLVIEDQAGNVSSVNLYTIRNLYTDLNTKKGLTFATIDNINGSQRMDSDPKKAIIMSVEGDWIFIRENLGGQAGSIKPNIDMAGGDDYLYVPNTITSGPQIDMGAGNDKIQIGGGLATGKYTFNLGNGNDILDIGKDVAYGALMNVDAGAGNDLIRVGSNLDGIGGNVNLGQGNDTVIVDGYIAGNKNFDFGTDDDTLIVNGKGRTDGISIFGNTKINMGAGDDTVMLAGDIGSDRVHFNVSVDGGDGNDTLFFTTSDVHTNLKRLLNFETIDLSGTGNNRLDVSIDKVKLNGNTAIDIDGISYTGLFIRGNAGDTVDLGANGGSAENPNLGGFREYSDNNKPDGYRAYWDGKDIHTMVYIQDGINII